MVINFFNIWNEWFTKQTHNIPWNAFLLGWGNLHPLKDQPFRINSFYSITGRVKDSRFCTLSFCGRRYSDKVNRTFLSSEVLEIAYSAISQDYLSSHVSYIYITGNETLNYISNLGLENQHQFEYSLDNAFIEISQGNVTGALPSKD